MTQEPTCRFCRMGRDEPGIDPVQEEFFVAEELSVGSLGKDLNGALVAEIVTKAVGDVILPQRKTRKGR